MCDRGRTAHPRNQSKARSVSNWMGDYELHMSSPVRTWISIWMSDRGMHQVGLLNSPKNRYRIASYITLLSLIQTSLTPKVTSDASTITITVPIESPTLHNE